MKKTLISTAILAVLTFGAVTAHADLVRDLTDECGPVGDCTIVYDVDLYDVKVNGTNPIDGTFDITYGYDPETMTLTRAVVGFLAADDQFLDGKETIKFVLDGVSLYTGTFKWGFELFAGQVTGEILGTLRETGRLEYSIVAKKGDFWFGGAGLAAVVCSVPDGGATVLLLGLGLLGMFGLRRVRRS